MQDQELAAVDLADVDALKFEVRESRGELGRWQRGEKKRLQLRLAVPVSHFFLMRDAIEVQSGKNEKNNP